MKCLTKGRNTTVKCIHEGCTVAITYKYLFTNNENRYIKRDFSVYFPVLGKELKYSSVAQSEDTVIEILKKYSVMYLNAAAKS